MFLKKIWVFQYNKLLTGGGGDEYNGFKGDIVTKFYFLGFFTQAHELRSLQQDYF